MADLSAAYIAAEAARNTARIALLGTGLTALVTFLVTILAQRSARRIQRELKKLERENGDELARLNALLAERKAELDARRDYDYEARKRLYKECEPLLFRLAEASENALYRVYSLARTAKHGDLGPARPSWLDDTGGYYMVSTLYNLLAPLAIYRLLQDRLTLVDLTVDLRIGSQYIIGKHIYITFTDDFEMASIDPAMPYSPFVPDWQDKREQHPEQYWRQGVPLGRLDAVLELMIVRPQGEPPRCMTYGEFMRAFNESFASGDSQLEIFADIFTGFHPQRRPILWRILVTQAVLHCALVRGFQRGGAAGALFLLGRNPHVDRTRLDWRQPGDGVDDATIDEPLRVAQACLGKILPPDMWRPCFEAV